MSGFHPRELINEVKIRPGIYNKDALEPPQRENKRLLWLEVAERLTPEEDWKTYSDVEKDARVDEISTKWKNLKDHFYREIKLHEAGEANKKRKYVYFDDMEFVRPFVGYRMPSINRRVKKLNEPLEDTQDLITNDIDIDMDAFLDDNIEEDVNKEEINENVIQEDRPKRIIKPTFKVVQNKPATSSSPLVNSLKKEAIIKNFEVLKKTGDATNSTFKIRDGDISFCLSLVPTLRKLSDSHKLRAKIEILKVLHFYVEQLERRHNFSNRSHSSNQNINSNIINQSADIEADMTEDYLEEFDDGVNIKRESDDPLTGNSGNTKIWWT